VEETLGNIVLWLKLIAEVIGAVLIGTGVLLTLGRFLRVLRTRTTRSYEKTRLLLARFLSLGLEFQLAADILGTTVAPSWAQIGKLGAIAVIRTGLNYFLAREMKEEEQAVEQESPAGVEGSHRARETELKGSAAAR
jgi:uncharacterized membrane protein